MFASILLAGLLASAQTAQSDAVDPAVVEPPRVELTDRQIEQQLNDLLAEEPD